MSTSTAFQKSRNALAANHKRNPDARGDSSINGVVAVVKNNEPEHRAEPEILSMGADSSADKLRREFAVIKSSA